MVLHQTDKKMKIESRTIMAGSLFGLSKPREAEKKNGKRTAITQATCKDATVLGWVRHHVRK
jgi:hypothetical protein